MILFCFEANREKIEKHLTYVREEKKEKSSRCIHRDSYQCPDESCILTTAPAGTLTHAQDLHDTKNNNSKK